MDLKDRPAWIDGTVLTEPTEPERRRVQYEKGIERLQAGAAVIVGRASEKYGLTVEPVLIYPPPAHPSTPRITPNYEIVGLLHGQGLPRGDIRIRRQYGVHVQIAEQHGVAFPSGAIYAEVDLPYYDPKRFGGSMTDLTIDTIQMPDEDGERKELIPGISRVNIGALRVQSTYTRLVDTLGFDTDGIHNSVLVVKHGFRLLQPNEDIWLDDIAHTRQIVERLIRTLNEPEYTNFETRLSVEQTLPLQAFACVDYLASHNPFGGMYSAPM
ncbi:hypothetical protein HY469_02060 [Candidatus Roizmanbacteria bacterium]|nr:hypothetical protein [Candidatus Roizmanbacteria bacterium]